MKRFFVFLIAVLILTVPFIVRAEGVETYDMTLSANCKSEAVEVGDQFLVNFKLSAEGKILPYLTFSMQGAFSNEIAEVVAPVYTNERIGVLTNKFDNENGVFKLEGYDQKIKGIEEPVVCSILFEAKKSGTFSLDIADETLVGKVNENAFYNLLLNDIEFEVNNDTDNKTVEIIKDAEPVTPFDMDIFGHWAEKQIVVMYKLGALENIASDSIDPDRNITRGEFAAMLVKVCKLRSSASVTPFEDVNEDEFISKPLKVLKALMIAKGDGEGSFNPDEAITRQDMYTLIFRTMMKMNKVNPEINTEDYLTGIDNAETIAPYAKDAWAGMLRAKIISAEEDGYAVEATKSVTIGEASWVLNKLAEFNILISGR